MSIVRVLGVGRWSTHVSTYFHVRHSLTAENWRRTLLQYTRVYYNILNYTVY